MYQRPLFNDLWLDQTLFFIWKGDVFELSFDPFYPSPLKEKQAHVLESVNKLFSPLEVV